MKEGFKVVGIPEGVSLSFYEPGTATLGVVYDSADQELVQPVLFDAAGEATVYFHGQFDVTIGGTGSAADLAWNSGNAMTFPRQTGVDLSAVVGRDDNIYSTLADSTVTFDPTGFVDGDNVDVSYDKVARTITLTHVSGFIVYKWRGLLKALASPWVSTAHPVGASRYFLSSVDGDNFAWGTVLWSFKDVQVAIAFPTLGFAVREPHGLMQHESHTENHDLLGTYRVSGLGPVTGTYTEATATDAATTPGFAAGVIKDEDNSSYVNATAEGLYTTMRIAAGSVATLDTTATFPFRSAGSYILVNTPSTGAEAATVNNRFVNIYEVLIPVTSDADSQKFRRVFLQPQVAYTSLAAAQAEDTRGLNLGDFSGLAPEFVFYTRLTYSTLAGNANTGKVTIPTGGVTYVLGTRVSQINVGAVLQGAVAENTYLDTIDGLSPTAPNVQAGFVDVVSQLIDLDQFKVERHGIWQANNYLFAGQTPFEVTLATGTSIQLSAVNAGGYIQAFVAGTLVSFQANGLEEFTGKTTGYYDCQVITLGVGWSIRNPAWEPWSTLNSILIASVYWNGVALSDLRVYYTDAELGYAAQYALEQRLPANSGIATNLKETSRIITDSATTTIDWSLGHVVINDVSLASLTITNVPTDATAFLTIMHLYTTGARSLGWVATNILSAAASYAAAGTSGGFDKYVLQPSGLGDGKFTVSCVESK